MSSSKPPVSPQARRKQIIVGLVVGLIVGVVIAYLTQFWMWLAAGIILGLASGAILRPPQETQNGKNRV